MILSRPPERAAAYEQDVGGVDLEKFLLGVPFRPPLRRYRCHGSFDELEQRLLDAFAGNVPGDGRIVRLARDLVDLVDVHDARLRLLHVVFALLEKLLDDVLDILADISGLGQRRRIGDGERHVEQTGEGLGEQCLPAAGGADEQHVALRQLDLVDLDPGFEPLVVVVDGDGKHLLRVVLADHVVVEDAVDLARRRQPARRARPRTSPGSPRE